MGFQNTWCGHCVWFFGALRGQVITGCQSRIWHQTGVRQGCVLSPKVFSFVWKWHWRNGWWIGLRRRWYPTAGLPLCWWHFAVCYIFQWSTLDGGCIGNLFEGGRIGTKCSNPRFYSTNTSLTLKTVREWKFWMRPSRTNGFVTVVSYQHGTPATKKLIRVSVCRLPQRPSVRTNGFCVTMFPWTLVSNLAGQRKLYRVELRKFDAHCRKFVRATKSIDWTQPWHSILDEWNQRIVESIQPNRFKFWSKKNIIEYSEFAQYLAILGDSRRLKQYRYWMLEAAGRDDPSIYGRLTGDSCDQILQVVELWGVGSLWLQYRQGFLNFLHMYYKC